VRRGLARGAFVSSRAPSSSKEEVRCCLGQRLRCVRPFGLSGNWATLGIVMSIRFRTNWRYLVFIAFFYFFFVVAMRGIVAANYPIRNLTSVFIVLIPYAAYGLRAARVRTCHSTFSCFDCHEMRERSPPPWSATRHCCLLTLGRTGCSGPQGHETFLSADRGIEA
jgi:hypothetical protein